MKEKKRLDDLKAQEEVKTWQKDEFLNAFMTFSAKGYLYPSNMREKFEVEYSHYNSYLGRANLYVKAPQIQDVFTIRPFEFRSKTSSFFPRGQYILTGEPLPYTQFEVVFNGKSKVITDF